MKILFVENDPRFSATVTRTFLAAHQVTVVPSLAGARGALARERFDAVLLDYDLDDGKGAELAEELCRDPDRPRIVAVSSHAAGNECLLHAGADVVCGKLGFARIDEVLGCLKPRSTP